MKGVVDARYGGGDMQDISVKAARFIAEHAPERIVLADVADHVGYSRYLKCE
jgi:hypothetical protein